MADSPEASGYVLVTELIDLLREQVEKVPEDKQKEDGFLDVAKYLSTARLQFDALLKQISQ